MSNLPPIRETDNPPWIEDDKEPNPKKGECAVCGRPVSSLVPPHKDTKLRFCEKHDYSDLRDKYEHIPEPPEDSNRRVW